MENKELAVRMKIRKHKNDSAKLTEIIESATSTDLEKKIASEYLNKATELECTDTCKSDTTAADTIATEATSSELTSEEVDRLGDAEKRFDKRQANRKTPSKADKNMRESKRSISASTSNLHESKRENLEESVEVSGLKVGSMVRIGDEEGIVVRIYRSADGKEKCMVKIGDGKPVKKRVTSVELMK